MRTQRVGRGMAVLALVLTCAAAGGCGKSERGYTSLSSQGAIKKINDEKK